jgi:hypothetical protein
METMYLVVGLAIVGLAGIVAAFYFSKRGGKRLRAAGTSRVAANRAGTAGRPPGRPPRTGQTEFALRASGPPRAAGDSRRPGTRAGTLTESWPSSPGDLEEFSPGDAWPSDTTDTDPGLRAAAPGLRAARADADADAFKDDRPRRRVGFRKGADIDEELWPADSFGGVSDEQFWDDVASDKPLTTTARTAQQEAGPRSRLRGNGPADSPGRRPAGGGAYPGARPAPEPAAERATAERTTAERTAILPTYAATQPGKSMTPPVPGGPQPIQNVPQAPPPVKPVKPAPPPPGPTQPVRTAGTGPAGQPRGVSAQPSDGGRRRRPASAEDDPLTSAAFSLRQRGPVDGRSYRPRDQRDTPRDQRDAARERNDAASGPGRVPASPYGHTAPYPPAGTSYDDESSATQMMITPPYGQDYGYGGGPEAQPDLPTEPRRPNGTRSHARPGAPGERARPPRPAHPQDTRPASGSYPAGAYGAYPGNGSQPGGNQGNGSRGSDSRGNGHRAPNDPRDDYRRLTHQR